MLTFIRNLFILFVLSSSSAFALGDAFDQARFDKLLKEGKPVLVTIHADWCTTCLTQGKILGGLLKTSPYNQLQVLRVDFDKQKKIVHAFKAQWQSTLIVFKNGKEVGRSTADTDKENIALLLRQAL